MGFEPTDPCGSPVFKTGALNRSAIPPESSNANNATGVRIGKLYSKIGKTRTESIGALNLPSGTRRRSEGSSMRSRTRAPVCRGFLGWDDGRGLSVCDRKNRLRNDEESKTTRKAAHAWFIVADPRSACLAAICPPASPAPLSPLALTRLTIYQIADRRGVDPKAERA